MSAEGLQRRRKDDSRHVCGRPSGTPTLSYLFNPSSPTCFLFSLHACARMSVTASIVPSLCRYPSRLTGVRRRTRAGLPYPTQSSPAQPSPSRAAALHCINRRTERKTDVCTRTRTSSGQANALGPQSADGWMHGVGEPGLPDGRSVRSWLAHSFCCLLWQISIVAWQVGRLAARGALQSGRQRTRQRRGCGCAGAKVRR
ncbi:hypothetical protein HDK64DRAFT_110155 [Phyllosticta capitalensis]